MARMSLGGGEEGGREKEKTTLGHYILLSGIHTARRTRRIGLGGGRGGGGRSRITSSPGGFFLFINPARLRLPLVIRVRAPPSLLFFQIIT